MTNDIKRSVILMEQDELKNLTIDVKETVAHDAEKNEETDAPQFSAADLWNIQKNRRNRTIRRNQFLN